jgi:ADYC domain
VYTNCVNSLDSKLLQTLGIAFSEAPGLFVDYMHRQVICLSVVCGLVACAEPVDVSSVVQFDRGGGCQWPDCENSPEMTHGKIWEFNLQGVPDINGYSLKSEGSRAILEKKVKVVIPNKPPTTETQTFLMSVDSFDRITGRNANAAIQGVDLVGARVKVLHNGMSSHDIVITGVRTIAFPNFPGRTIEIYKMEWTAPGGEVPAGTSTEPRQPICNDIPSGFSQTNPELYGMEANENIVFRGDRFDPRTITVLPGAQDMWVNFGCAGKTLSKVYLTRATVHTTPDGNFARRQAMLRHFTADYCGNGRTWTITGAKVQWKYRQPIVAQSEYREKNRIEAIIPASHRLEARWSEHGATCLGFPRLGMLEDSETVEALIDRIHASPGCSQLPLCSDPGVPGGTSFTDWGGTNLVSANWIP